MKNLPLFSLLLVSVVSFSQIGIGTNSPAPSAQLDVTTTTKGFLPPRMTTVQRDAIVSPATGLQVYNTTTNTNDYYNGTIWTTSDFSGTLPISSGGTGLATIGTNGQVLTSNGTSASWATPTSSTAVTGPLFQAYQSSSQTWSSNTQQVVNCQTEVYDVGNCFNTSNSRYTPNVAGYYMFLGAVQQNNGLNNVLYLQKNSVNVATVTDFQNSQANGGGNIFGPVYMNGTTDYVELVYYSFVNCTSYAGVGQTYFSGYMVNSNQTSVPIGSVTGLGTGVSTAITTIGTNGQVLTSNGTSASWANPVTATYGSAVMTNGATVTLPPLADASTATNVLNFTLPSAGTWDISVQMRVAITTSTQNVFYCLCVYDNTSTLVANSEAFFNSTPATAGIGLNSTGYTRIIVTTTGAATYSLRGYQPGGTANIFATSDGVGRTKVIWVKIQ